jgi:hypothetical protein
MAYLVGFTKEITVRQLVYVRLLLQLLFLHPTKLLSAALGSRSFTDSQTLPNVLIGQSATLPFVRLHTAHLLTPQE